MCYDCFPCNCCSHCTEINQKNWDPFLWQHDDERSHKMVILDIMLLEWCFHLLGGITSAIRISIPLWYHCTWFVHSLASVFICRAIVPLHMGLYLLNLYKRPNLARRCAFDIDNRSFIDRSNSRCFTHLDIVDWSCKLILCCMQSDSSWQLHGRLDKNIDEVSKPALVGWWSIRACWTTALERTIWSIEQYQHSICLDNRIWSCIPDTTLWLLRL